MQQSDPQRRGIASGFTFIEVLVACSILAVGLSAILTLYASSLKGVALAKSYEEAGIAAQNIMTETLYASYNAPFRHSGKCDTPQGATWRAVGEADVMENVDKITVTVTFQHGGKTMMVELTTSQISTNMR